ncbi:MAG: hypothetical protein AB1610_02660 [Nitrospirota bacterium]
MKIIAITFFSLIMLIAVYGQIISHISKKPIEEKLGYLPQKEVMKIAAMGHRALISEWLFFKVIVYYGGRFETDNPLIKKNIEYYNMYRFLDASTYINPYNIDSYYFAEAIFTWELGRIKEVNYLLERGLKYRTWDFYLPFFLSFNHFYFLKDYKQASKYMEQTARITGNLLHANLAARFLYESDETGVAISFLKLIIENTWNLKVKQTLEIRLKTLEAVYSLEKGMKRFEEIYRHKPKDIKEMIDNGIINKIPEDPYGGRFYIDDKGKIRTTSKFAFGVKDGHSNKDRKPE